MSEVAGPIAALVVISALFAVVPVLQWLGRWPRGHPDLITQRAYLLLPIPLMFLLFALGMAVGPVVGRGGALTIFVLGLLSSATGMVLAIWQPERLRPRWQKEQKARGGR